MSHIPAGLVASGGWFEVAQTRMGGLWLVKYMYF
jgi:hypothetical protein